MGGCSSVSSDIKGKEPISSNIVIETEEEIPHSLMCSVCLALLATATTFTCGHAICWGCAHKWVGGDKTKGCPECRKPVGEFRRCIALDTMARDFATKWPVESEKRVLWEANVSEGLKMVANYKISTTTTRLPVRGLVRRSAFSESAFEVSDTDSDSDSGSNSEDAITDLIGLHELLSAVDALSDSSDDSLELALEESDSDDTISSNDFEETTEMDDDVHGDGLTAFTEETISQDESTDQPNANILSLNADDSELFVHVKYQLEVYRMPTEGSTVVETTSAIASLASYALSAATSAVVLSGAMEGAQLARQSVCPVCHDSFKVGSVRGYLEQGEWTHLQCLAIAPTCLAIVDSRKLQFINPHSARSSVEVRLNLHCDFGSSIDQREGDQREAVASNLKTLLEGAESQRLRITFSGSLWPP